MEWLFILLTGIIQGATEFIPVSSSGHLLLLGSLFDFDAAFELYVLANIGTLGALIWFSRQQLLRVIQEAGRGQYALVAKLFVGILPAGLLGFFLVDFFRLLSDQLYVLVVMLMLVGALMLFRPPAVRDAAGRPEDISWPKVIVIGLAQALALVPGTSRAGATILGGMWLGLRQELAARWSFLMAAPLVAGAVARVLISPEGAEFVSRQFARIVGVNLVSFLVGLAAIHLLMTVLERRSLRVFGFYRLGLGTLLLTLLLTNVL